MCFLRHFRSRYTRKSRCIWNNTYVSSDISLFFLWGFIINWIVTIMRVEIKSVWFFLSWKYFNFKLRDLFLCSLIMTQLERFFHIKRHCTSITSVYSYIICHFFFKYVHFICLFRLVIFSLLKMISANIETFSKKSFSKIQDLRVLIQCL
jgi:hypothetical protein